jgi:hypothetical protein
MTEENSSEPTVKPADDSGTESGENLESGEASGPHSIGEAVEAMSPDQAATFRLARLAAIHALFWILALGLFAAADSWRILSDFAFASFFSLVTGVLAGLVTTTLIHEWGHYVGARRSKGAYTIPEKPGVFVYDWDFRNNSVDQFHTMSIAGSIGGAVALILVWTLLPADTIGRIAVHAGAIAGFVFAAVIEWPILKRTRAGADPMTELGKIDQAVLTRAFGAATLAGVVTLLLYMP